MEPDNSSVQPSLPLSASSPERPPSTRHWAVTVLWLTPALFLILVVAYGLWMRDTTPEQTGAPRVGQPAPDFTLPDLQGHSVQLATYRGQVVFLNVWATWCPPCVDEMPTIQRLHEQFYQNGLAVLTVSIDALGTQVVAPFMERYGLTFPVLLDNKATLERLYHTGGVPESFILDKDGRLVEKIVGPRDWTNPQLVALFQRLLDTTPAN